MKVDLRTMRREGHLIINSLVRKKVYRTREIVYTMLAREMKINLDKCHFSTFTEKEAEKAIAILRKWRFGEDDVWK